MESDLWPAALAVLQTRMSRTTFDHCLAQTVAVRKNGTLTVMAPLLTIDWLEHRLRPLIESVIPVVAGRPLKIKFAAQKETA